MKSTALCASLALALLCLPGLTAAQTTAQTPAGTATASVYAQGLDSPFGLRFGPDGALYVAEGGEGGSTPASGQLVPPPVGPYTGGKTARISRIAADGTRTTVAQGLPSAQNSPMVGSSILGVADIEFVGNTLYALLSGGGASHGNPDAPNAILRVNADGTTTLVADLSAFVRANPVAAPNADDFEPDGTWYSMTHIGSDLYAVEPNHGELDKISATGAVSRVVDFSAILGHVVPTSVTVGPDGSFYVGNLTTIPFVDGNAHVFRVTPDGHLSIYASGLTAVLGVAFDREGRLNVLETSTSNTLAPPNFVPNSGKVVRMTAAGTFETIATGLNFPTAMTFGPDGALYISTMGFNAAPGQGQIVRITPP